ncbi:YdcH family protein [Leptospira interrogans]
MSASPHLAELAKKHRLLEQKIQEELARPSVDSVRVSSLKLEKLRLKDMIAQMNPAIRH